MSAPWFDPTWAWLPGTAFGVIGGLWGSLVGVLAPRGKGKGLIVATYAVLMVAGVAMLMAGLYGLIDDQPYGVWYGLLLPGVITLLVLGPLGLVARLRYREAEFRKMHATEM